MARRGETALLVRHQVFVSHAGPDTWVARQIARGIRECEADPFLDEADIQAGQDFETEILGALDKADELVVLLTPWALARSYVWVELGAAWGLRIPIIVLLHGVSPTNLQSDPRATVFLKAKNCLELNDANKYFAELRERVQRPSRAKGGRQ